MKDGKPTVIDGIHAELINNLGENMHILLSEIITKSYETEAIPEVLVVNSRTIFLSKNGTTGR